MIIESAWVGIHEKEKKKKKKDKKEGQLHINGKEAAVDVLCHCMALKIRKG